MKKLLKSAGLAALLGFLLSTSSSLSAAAVETSGSQLTAAISAQSGTVFLPNNYSLRRPPSFRTAPAREREAAPERREAPAREMEIGRVSDSIDDYLVRLDKSAPEMVGLDDPFDYKYTVTAKHKLQKVVVTEEIPEGAVFVSADPEADVDGNTVTWTLYDLEKGETRDLTLTVRAEEIVDLSNCATIKAYPAACTTTRVGQPVLELTKTTPREQVLLDSSVQWNIVVENTGDFPANEVVVTDTLPAGVSHASGSSELVYEIGTLNPGERRNIEILTTTTEVGEHVNTAEVTSSNAGSASDDARIVVEEAGLEVEKSGEDYQFLGRNSTYTIVVTNTGQVDLYDITVVDSAPAQTTIQSASGAMIEGNTATWEISTLPAGESREFSITLTSRELGTHCNRVSVSESSIGLRASDEACTEWRGYPALLIEAIDLVDPLGVGEETTYVVTVTNQGSAPDFNLAIVCEITAEMEFVSASGAAPGQVEARKVTFETVDRLDPGASIEFRIRARAVEIGDVRFRADLTSDLLRRPVSTGEATQVY